MSSKIKSLSLFIITAWAIYLYKYPIDPFLPINVASIYAPIYEAQMPLQVSFGKVLLKVTGVGVRIMDIPIFLIPQIVLLLNIIRKTTRDITVMFLGLLVVSIFTEGIYIFRHHMGFTLFLTNFSLIISIYNSHRNKSKNILLSIIVFLTLNLVSYKLTYLTVLLIVFILIFQQFQNLKIGYDKHLSVLLAIYTVLIFGFNGFLYAQAVSDFKVYVYYGIDYGIKRFLDSLLNKRSLNYCIGQICFREYTYSNILSSAFFGKVGYIIVYGVILFSTLYFIYKLLCSLHENKKKVNNIPFILFAFLVSGVALAFTYSLLGLFHLRYIFLPSSFILVQSLSKVSNNKIKKMAGYLLVLSIILVYTGTILSMDKHFNPFSDYEIITASACKWTSLTTDRTEKIQADVYSRGIYTIFWSVNNRMSGYPYRMTLRDLAELYTGNAKWRIFILNYNLPWLEMENWYKIYPPVEYRKYARVHYNLIYSSKLLDIIQSI